MPRIARVIAVGFPHHIIQRGNNRQKVFFAQVTREKYLDLLKEYSQKWKAGILAYCLMDNHVHLLIRPQNKESLAKLMQGVTLSYTKYRNKRYNKTGRLWESRYYSCVVDEEKYLWAVARYIEQNPVRARMVRKPEDYSYSSACGHITGTKDEVLNEKLFEGNESSDYVKFIRSAIPEKEINSIRLATKRNKPLGNINFLKKIEKLLNIDFRNNPPGRPRK
jgi:putative transposase